MRKRINLRDRRDMGRGIAAGRVYTPEQLAELLQVGKQTIYNKLSLGQRLPKCFRVGSRVRFMGSDVLAFIREQQT